MLAIAVPLFALTWWAACYLIGRDPARRAHWRAAAALSAYAIGVVFWTVLPGSTVAEIFLCLPALWWAGTAVAMLPETMPERRQIDLGWALLSALFLLVAIVLPTAGRLIVLAPLAGGLLVLWRFRGQLQPPLLPAALAVFAGLYGVGLAALLVSGSGDVAGLVLATIGLDLLTFGFLVAVAGAVDAGERLRPDLVRSGLTVGAVLLLVGGPVLVTLRATTGDPGVAVAQFVLVGAVLTATGLAGPVRRALDRAAFVADPALRRERGTLLLVADALPRLRERQALAGGSAADFHRFTRQALDHYADPGRLLRSPLINLPEVAGRLNAGTVGHPLARVEALRAVLRECVDRLRPAGAFEVTDDWRYYLVLHFCVVRGLNPYERRPQTDGLDRETRRALDWMRRYVPRQELRRWRDEGADLVARQLWSTATRST